MFFNNKSKKPIFSIHYYSDTEYEFKFAKTLSNEDIANIGSFIFLLVYNSPISVNIIDKLKQQKNKDNSSDIDHILNSWATYYLSDKNKPIIEPLIAFKNNVK